MYNGGLVGNQRLAQLVRFSSLIIPVVLAFYGVLIQYGSVPSDHYLNGTLFLLIIIPWLMLAALRFLHPSKNLYAAAVLLAIFHSLTAAYIFFVSGFDALLLSVWALLFLESYAYFSDSGLRLSVVSLFAVAGGDGAMHANNPTIFLANMMSAIGVLLIGGAIVMIIRGQTDDKAELLRSQAEESLQRDRILTLINNLADAVISTNEKGIIQVYNAACLNLLDTNKNLEGQPLDAVLLLSDGDNAPVRLIDLFKKARGTNVRDDLTTSIAEERLRLEVTYSPIRSSYSGTKKPLSQDGYIVILRDVTKSKSLEEERDEFISVVSHELRTPITIAEGTISNVKVMMERPNISDKILAQGINMAHEQVIFLAKMVNDLSTLSRAERGVADTPELIDVRSLLNELYAEYAPQAEKKQLHFNLDAGVRLGKVTASRLYLQELLQNFITNAIKYTKEGSVTLKVERKKDILIFEVSDTGIGISKTDQAKIFNKFYRSEDYRTRETGGTGLGLYVAVKLAHKLRTKIDMSSRLNHGSRFSFELPVEDA